MCLARTKHWVLTLVPHEPRVVAHEHLSFQHSGGLHKRSIISERKEERESVKEEESVKGRQKGGRKKRKEKREKKGKKERTGT